MKKQTPSLSREQLGVLQAGPMFVGMEISDIQALLPQLDAKASIFQKDEIILHAGEPVNTIGIVLSGSLNVEFTDILGNVSILQRIEQGGVFAETYACLPDTPLMVDVAAVSDGTALFLNARQLLNQPKDCSSVHSRIMYNLLLATMQKNLNLSGKIFCTSTKSTRGRLIAYLSQYAALVGKSSFSIPFDRQQLANYLGVERSAMSAELSRMQRDGILEYRKNHFTLHGFYSA